MSALGETDKIESLSERRELSDAAKALLADKAFDQVIRQLRQRWFGQLMLLPHDSALQSELTARLRALEAIPTELSTLLTDFREAQRKAHRNA